MKVVIAPIDSGNGDPNMHQRHHDWDEGGIWDASVFDGKRNVRKYQLSDKHECISSQNCLTHQEPIVY